MNNRDFSSENSRIFELMSLFLNLYPKAISASEATEIATRFGISEELAYSQLLASFLGMDIIDSPADKGFFNSYFPKMIKKLCSDDFDKDRYYAEVVIPDDSEGSWELKHMTLAAGEAFVRNDPLYLPDGRIIPQIGYFDRPFTYPAVTENGTEWMTLMPNETVTSADAIERSHGRVLTYGLGLGYFVFHAAEKCDVTSVTVVEKDPRVIKLFEKHILPQLPHSEKVAVVCADAFEFAEGLKDGDFDFVFADIWHDPSDGVERYKRLKALESRCPCAEYVYWLEKTLLLYM